MPRSIEQLYRPPQEFPVDASCETMHILQALDVNPDLAKKFLALEGGLVNGDYSYMLTLHSKPGESSKIQLTLEPFDGEEIYEETWEIADKRRREVSRRWRDDAELIRFGQLSVTDTHLTERRPTEMHPLSDLALNAVLETHGNGRSNNLGFEPRS